MGKRKRATQKYATTGKKRKLEDPPSSGAAASRVFGVLELLTLILLYLPPKVVLRIQRVNKFFRRAVNGLDIQRRVFFAPIENDTRTVWNPLYEAAFPRWFPKEHMPMMAGEIRYLTYYELPDGKKATRSSRDGENASWRRMLICQPALTSIHVLHRGETIERRENLKLVTMGDVHDEIEYVRSRKDCPHFQNIDFACGAYGQGMGMKILLV